MLWKALAWPSVTSAKVYRLLLNYNFTVGWEGQLVVKSQQLLCGMPLIIGLNSLNQMDPFFPPKILFCDVVT